MAVSMFLLIAQLCAQALASRPATTVGIEAALGPGDTATLFSESLRGDAHDNAAEVERLAERDARVLSASLEEVHVHDQAKAPATSALQLELIKSSSENERASIAQVANGEASASNSVGITQIAESSTKVSHASTAGELAAIAAKRADAVAAERDLVESLEQSAESPSNGLERETEIRREWSESSAHMTAFDRHTAEEVQRKEAAMNLAPPLDLDDSSFGSKGCPCIGFTNVPGTLYAKVASVEGSAPYPADVGGRCATWDASFNPECTAGENDPVNHWCHAQWCFVDACNCNLPAHRTIIFLEARLNRRPLYYSYDTCGAKDVFTTLKNPSDCTNFHGDVECWANLPCAWNGTACRAVEQTVEGRREHCHFANNGDSGDLFDGGATRTVAAVRPLFAAALLAFSLLL